MRPLKALVLLGLVVAASGCIDRSPDVLTSTDRLSIESNSSEEFTFQVKNNYNRPDTFTVVISEIGIARVNDSLDSEERYIYYMGDAPSGGTTRKKTVFVTGIPEALGNLDQGEKEMMVEVYNSTQKSLGNPVGEGSVTVEVSK